MKNANIALYFILIILVMSCNVTEKNSSNNIENDNVENSDITCDIVEEILFSDQLYRQRSTLGTYEQHVLDSILASDGHEGWWVLNDMKKEAADEYRQRAKEKSLKVPAYYNIQRDSLWDLQLDIDRENTQRLINIVNNVGFNGLDTMDFDCSYKSFLVFVHTPEEYIEEVKNLVESGKGHIGEGQYNHIMWHLKGRNDKDIVVKK